MRGQIVDHQRAVVLLQYEIGQGQDAELQRFASDILPAVLDHLDMVRTLTEQLAGTNR